MLLGIKNIYRIKIYGAKILILHYFHFCVVWERGEKKIMSNDSFELCEVVYSSLWSVGPVFQERLGGKFIQ